MPYAPEGATGTQKNKDTCSVEETKARNGSWVQKGDDNMDLFKKICNYLQNIKTPNCISEYKLSRWNTTSKPH
jgi:hypothetical protein